MDAVFHRPLHKVERADPQACSVDAIFRWIGTAAMMCVNAADGAEMMFGDTGVEAVSRELVRTLLDLEVLRR